MKQELPPIPGFGKRRFGRVRCNLVFGSEIDRVWHTVQVFAKLIAGTLLALSCLNGQVAHGHANRRFTLDRDVDTSVWHHFPRWDGAMLVGYENNFTSGPIIYTLDREGRRDETLFTLQDGAQITIINIAASASGEIAIVGSALTADQRGATFLARIAPDHTRQTITRTWPYCPMAVTFAPDGSVWTVGNLKNDGNTRDVAFHVLRRFDASGRILGSSAVQVKGGNGGDAVSYLRSSRDRVGWFTNLGEYIEFSLNGSEMARYDAPDGVGVTHWKDTSMAMSEGNDVVVGRFWTGKAEFVVLDRERRIWSAASVLKEHAPAWSRVLGFDGTTLVTTHGNSGLRRFETK